MLLRMVLPTRVLLPVPLPHNWPPQIPNLFDPKYQRHLPLQGVAHPSQLLTYVLRFLMKMVSISSRREREPLRIPPFLQSTTPFRSKPLHDCLTFLCNL